MTDSKNIDANIANVKVVPSPGGVLVPVSGEMSAMPCLSMCVLTAEIVQDPSHDNWNPIDVANACKV